MHICICMYVSLSLSIYIYIYICMILPENGYSMYTKTCPPPRQPCI